jgi:hypothetical protein
MNGESVGISTGGGVVQKCWIVQSQFGNVSISLERAEIENLPRFTLATSVR